MKIFEKNDNFIKRLPKFRILIISQSFRRLQKQSMKSISRLKIFTGP